MATVLNIVGQVVDASDGMPIQGVTVEKLVNGNGTGQMVQTDVQGLFNFAITSDNGLRFTHASYQTEDYVSADLFEGTNNVVHLFRDNKTLPGVTITAKKSAVMWILIGALGALAYWMNKKRR